MLGLAVGDALGFPCEFRRREQILSAFPPAGVTDFVGLLDPRWPPRPAIVAKAHPPGTYTDDTQMTLAVAHALVDAGRDASVDDILQRVGKRFVMWAGASDNDRAPGATCMAGCRKLARGVSWRDAGVPDSKGCGSAMRVAPIGLAFHDDLPRLLEVARASSLPTHGHDAAVEGAAAAALLVALALKDASPREMFDEVLRECAPRSPDFARCFARVPDLLDAPPEVALSARGLGESWVAEEAVASALWCYWKRPTDFAGVVLTAANTDGDSDSIACIAGSIAGAALGEDAIDARWRRGIENAEALVKVADALLALRGSSTA